MGGLFFYLGNRLFIAFYSLFSKKIEWTLIKSGSFTLYKLPIFIRTLYSPTI